MESDFTQKMRPRGPRVKIIAAKDRPPIAGSSAFSDRPKLYEILAARDKGPAGDEG